ncbi:hypothetical protein Pmani_015326 [Petrolisthes manimaculis]|uniref:Rheb n=1 Tax=Petrolisthes manimaculis TaxID=1843537 RepID=A0AAE1P991_9EUCA|nr:hypothetical protein Pmani_023873 [Petrolisthes manimaculis]KAK4313317.1 hypothetical protein Pmani_015326 [Petrolisthes manimaculis]
MPPKSRKVAVMGYRSVGKSSLCIQFVDGQFVDSYNPTIENTFTKKLKVRGQEYGLELVDTAGQDEYSIFPAQYSMNIHGYVLVYSITSEKSFEVAQIIYDKILDMMGKVTVPVVLVGNKTDLHVERVVTTDAGRRVADKWKAVFLETSSKQHESVSDIFTRVILEIEKADGNLSQGDKCLLS